jgi:hypothetical protein
MEMLNGVCLTQKVKFKKIIKISLKSMDIQLFDAERVLKRGGTFKLQL